VTSEMIWSEVHVVEVLLFVAKGRRGKVQALEYMGIDADLHFIFISRQLCFK